MRQLVGETVLQGANREDEVAERMAVMAQTLMPNIGPTMEHFFARHLLEIIRGDVLGAEQIAQGTIGGSREAAVAFADLVGFTRLGGRVAAEDLGAVARRLEAIAADATGKGVRIVKTIGDAVMLTGDAEALLRSCSRSTTPSTPRARSSPRCAAASPSGRSSSATPTSTATPSTSRAG